MHSAGTPDLGSVTKNKQFQSRGTSVPITVNEELKCLKILTNIFLSLSLWPSLYIKEYVNFYINKFIRNNFFYAKKKYKKVFKILGVDLWKILQKA